MNELVEFQIITFFRNIFCLKSLVWPWCLIKFMYSEKATKFCEISTLLLSYVVPVKSKMDISQSFVAFSEYINFKIWIRRTSKILTYLVDSMIVKL